MKDKRVKGERGAVDSGKSEYSVYGNPKEKIGDFTQGLKRWLA